MTNMPGPPREPSSTSLTSRDWDLEELMPDAIRSPAHPCRWWKEGTWVTGSQPWVAGTCLGSPPRDRSATWGEHHPCPALPWAAGLHTRAQAPWLCCMRGPGGPGL